MSSYPATEGILTKALQLQICVLHQQILFLYLCNIIRPFHLFFFFLLARGCACYYVSFLIIKLKTGTDKLGFVVFLFFKLFYLFLTNCARQHLKITLMLIKTLAQGSPTFFETEGRFVLCAHKLVSCAFK